MFEALLSFLNYFQLLFLKYNQWIKIGSIDDDCIHDNKSNYRDESLQLHWDPKVPRKGLGNLLKKVNHIAIVVSDVSKSLAFYVEVLGLQQIRRPNFYRHGAWLTLGNMELHLIKGVPVVPTGDSLIVPHISVESDDIEGVLKRLTELKVQFSTNVSVPDCTESQPVTQYFIRDPDGYYVELCNCDVLTDFCLGKDESGVRYKEIAENVKLSHIFKLAFLSQKALDTSGRNDLVTIPPEHEWATEPDPVKLNNMLARRKTYGDLMQGETVESIGLALRQSKNRVPLASNIIQAKKKGKEVFVPPAFFVEGDKRYQPSVVVPPIERKAETFRIEMKDNTDAIVRKTFKHFDVDGDGVLSIEELANVLRSLRQNLESPADFTKMLEREDLNKDVIDIQEFINLIKYQPPVDALENWEAFFNLLDIDGNGKVTVPELAMIFRELNFDLHDSHVENLFIDMDEDGSGYLTIDEIRNYFLKNPEALLDSRLQDCRRIRLSQQHSQTDRPVVNFVQDMKAYY